MDQPKEEMVSEEEEGPTPHEKAKVAGIVIAVLAGLLLVIFIGKYSNVLNMALSLWWGYVPWLV